MNGVATGGGDEEALEDTQDPLASRHYDTTAHIDALLPSVESLSLLPRIDSKLQRYEIELQRSIRELRATAIESRRTCSAEITQVDSDLKMLFQDVETTQIVAKEVEGRVADMTSDIKKLDTAKKNLTNTMTIIKRLQMLMTAFGQLQKLAAGKKYAETASLLSAVLQLMTHFRAYRSVPQIALLSQNIADVQRSLLEKVSADFEMYFTAGLSPQSKETLKQACELVDVLGEGPRDRIVMWYTNAQLREYRNIFRGNEEAALLDNISRRYAWLKRIFKTFDDEHAALFPASWKVFDSLVKSSCDTTREDLGTVLSRARPKIEVLLQALQESLDFEKYLNERASTSIQTPRASVDSVRSVQSDSSAVEKRGRGIRISEAFEPYLGQFVEVQDQTLAKMFIGYRNAPWPGMDEQVLPSSADLFYFYLTTVTQCAQLSNGEPLWQFARVMAKYLNEYADKILNVKYQTGVVTVEEIIMVLKTSDYCSTTTQQLEERMKATIASPYVDKVTYEFQNQTFLALTNRSMSLLVSHLEKIFDIGLKEMNQVQWADMSEVGDHSPYVSMLVAGLLREGKRVLQNLGKERFTRIFCDRVVESFVNAYVASIARCRPVNEAGAEQMLLDVHAIKVALLNLPGSETTQSYTKLVNKQIARIEVLLKVLLSTTSPPEGLVQNYLFLIQDKNTTNFIKILDLKGVTKQQQQPLLNLFITSVSAYEGELADRNPLLSNMTMNDPRMSEDRKLDPSAFFRDQLGIGSLPVTRSNTPGGAGGGGGQERFGSQFGKLFSKRTMSGQGIPTSPKT